MDRGADIPDVNPGQLDPAEIPQMLENIPVLVSNSSSHPSSNTSGGVKVCSGNSVLRNIQLHTHEVNTAGINCTLRQEVTGRVECDTEEHADIEQVVTENENSQIKNQYEHNILSLEEGASEGGVQN